MWIIFSKEFFQRAMSKNNKISTLTVYKGKGGDRCSVIFDNFKILKLSGDGNCYCIPIRFIPESRFDQMRNAFSIEALISNDNLFAEPM